MLSAKTLAILAVTLLSAEAGRDLDQQWQDFKTKFAKEYTEEVELARRAVWEDNYHFMEEHNAAYKKGLKTYEVGKKGGLGGQLSFHGGAQCCLQEGPEDLRSWRERIQRPFPCRICQHDERTPLFGKRSQGKSCILVKPGGPSAGRS